MKNKILLFVTLTLILLLFTTICLAQQMKTKQLILPFHEAVTEVTYQVVDGMAIMEGDILLGRDEDLIDFTGLLPAIIQNDDKYRWPNGIMPYIINSKISAVHGEKILEAINHVNSKTFVKILPRTNEKDYVEFIYHDGKKRICWSSVGRQKKRQTIRLHKEGCGVGTLIHEIGHALGMWHEQSRTDRDKHIEIKWENVDPNYVAQFKKHLSNGKDIGSYDYGSIMHYKNRAFSVNGQPTIVPIKNGAKIGQREGLSTKDIYAINYMYPPISGKLTGTFKKTNKKSLLWVGASWKYFTKKWKQFVKSGYHLTDIEIHKENGKTVYNGVFTQAKGGNPLYRFKSWSAFTSKWKELRDKNYRLIDIETFKSGNNRWYIGVWQPGKGGYGLFRYKSWSAFTSKWKELGQKNLNLIDIETYKSGDKQYYIGVWKAGSKKYALYNFDSWKKFKEKSSELRNKGFALKDFERYKSNGRFMYLGVWKEGNSAHLWHNVNWASFVQKVAQYNEDGYQLVDIDKH